MEPDHNNGNRMKWPWQKTEPIERREVDYTDALVAAIQSQNSGTATNATANATGAVEAAAGIIGRCFAAADIEGPASITEALTPHFLNTVGRSLIRHGEFVAYLDVDEAGDLIIFPAADWDISGDYMDWMYRLNLAGPSRTQTRSHVGAESVLHIQYAANPSQPWKGIGPLQAARIAGRLSAETANALADEVSGPRGFLLGVPSKDGKDSTLENLRADIRGLKGNLATVESRQTWAEDSGTRTRREWMPDRIGAHPPDSLIQQLDAATREVLAACGIPPGLIAGGDGTSLREEYRRLLHGTVAPLGRIIQAELRRKIHEGIGIGFDSLFAADIAGRARAFQSLVGAGMALDEAAGLSGLLVDDSAG